MKSGGLIALTKIKPAEKSGFYWAMKIKGNYIT
jgi:hypothetical protein